MKPLSSDSQFILWQLIAVKNNFEEIELSHKCSTLALARLFVAAAATVYQEPHFWRAEARNSCISVTKNVFKFEFLATHDLI